MLSLVLTFYIEKGKFLHVFQDIFLLIISKSLGLQNIENGLS